MGDEPRPVDDPVKQLTAIAWYDAATMRALLVAAVGLLGIVLSLFGVDEALFSEKAAKIVDALSTVISLGGVLWAGIARARQPTPPIKLSQARADVHNTTVLPETLNAATAQSVSSVPPAGSGGLHP